MNVLIFPKLVELIQKVAPSLKASLRKIQHTSPTGRSPTDVVSLRTASATLIETINNIVHRNFPLDHRATYNDSGGEERGTDKLRGDGGGEVESFKKDLMGLSGDSCSPITEGRSNEAMQI